MVFVVNRGRLEPSSVVNHGRQTPLQTQQNRSWTTGTPVVILMLVAKQTLHRINGSSRQIPMKTNTTKNLASVVMLVILSPFLALAILVSIKTAGIRDNEVLLLLLTLLSAVLSGINGFGRRTSSAISPSLVRVTTPTHTKGATK
jgi:hypothetical protein